MTFNGQDMGTVIISRDRDMLKRQELSMKGGVESSLITFSQCQRIRIRNKSIPRSNSQTCYNSFSVLNTTLLQVSRNVYSCNHSEETENIVQTPCHNLLICYLSSGAPENKPTRVR
jgi:hypothetical protein